MYKEETLKTVCPGWYKKHFVDEDTKFTPAELRRWKELRKKAVPCTTEQWFFLANDLLGYYFQPDVHSDLFAQFPQLDSSSGKHFYDLSPDIKKVLILWSRGTFKSTAVVVFIVACLLFDPDLFVMIISGNEKLAKRLLKEVKSHFESPSPKFAKLFPEYCRTKLGNQSEFELPCRLGSHSGSPSVAISTSHSAKAGLHPDLLLCDDIVHEQNYRSVSSLEKCWEEFQMLEPLVNPGGYTIVTGTRYSYGDTHELIQELAKKENIEFGKTVWRISVKTCWKDGDKDKGPMFDERVISHMGKKKTIGNSMDFLLRKQQSMGIELFGAQYENHPIPSGTQSFTPELLDSQTFHWLRPPDLNFKGPCLPSTGVDFVVGDLAFVGAEQRDSTVFYICRLFNSQIWVYDCVSGVWGSAELVHQLWNSVIFKYRPQVVFIEKIPAHDSYDYSFRSYAVQRGIQRYPIQWINMGTQADAKKIRIGSIQTALEQKRIWLYAGMPNYDTLRQQLERFPKMGRHDDYADCIGIAINAPTGWYCEAATSASSMPEMLRIARQDDETKVDIGKAGSIIVCG